MAKGGKIKVIEKSSDGRIWSRTFPQGDGRAYQSAKNRIKDLGGKFSKVMIDNKEISLKEFYSLEDKFENQSFVKDDNYDNSIIGKAQKYIEDFFNGK